jgi:autotransporter-associated beta strand protein
LNVSNNGTGTGTLTLGAVSDGGANHSITLMGGGTLSLFAGGTYGGNTNINAGALIVTNPSGSATGTGTVTLAANTTLAGIGSIGGPTVVSSGAHVSPGVGAGNIGTLTLATTNLNSGANLDVDLGAISNDAVHAGALTLGSNLNVNLNLLAGFPIGTYTLATSTGIAGSPTFTVSHSGPGDIYGSHYVVSQQGNNIVLNINVASQKWTGAAGSGGNGSWDTASVNWDPAVNGGVFADNSFNQVFDDTGTNTNISIPAPVSPLGVRFANNTVTYTIATGSQPISGPAVVVIQGPGTVNLNSPNAHTGGTNILGGTVNIGDVGALGTGPVTIAGGTIDNTTGQPFPTLANNFVFAGNLTYAGTANSLDLGSGTVTLAATPTITVLANTLRIDGNIGDGGNGFGFTKAGPGELDLVGNTNTYSGTTTLLNGTLVVSNATLGGGSAPLVVNGGTLSLGGTTQNVGPVTITGGSILSGTLSATAFNINNSADLALDPSLVLAGTGALTKNGAGVLTLAGMTNTYAGGTTVNSSTVSIDGDANLGAPATLTLNGSTLLVTVGTAANAAAGTATLSAGRGITLGASGGTISIGFVDTTPTAAGNNGHLASEVALVYNGVITGPGGLTVVGQAGIDQVEQSILDLGAVATYQGNTTINSAIAQVNSGITGTTATGANPLVNVLPTGTVLNLINNGAWNIDSNSSSLTVAGLTGDATGRFGTTNTGSFSTLTIGGAGTYTFPGVIGAITVAGKLGHDDRLGLIMNGTGTQILSGANTYAGGTTVTSGTLTTTATGSIGNGFLTVSAADTITSVMNIGSNQPITSLSGTVAGSGSARVNVSGGVTLTDSQTTATTFAGTLALGAAAAPHGGGTLRTTGSGALEIQGAPSLGNNSNINVTTTGTVRFNVAGGSAVVGTGVQAAVQDTAILELAGSVSALSQASGGRVDVLNNSAAATGLHVTGTNQQVGGVDGTGTTQVEAGASLTANHIVQGALVINGNATTPGLVNIAASDASGNPLASSSRLAIAGSIAAAGSGAKIVSGTFGSSSLPASGGLTAESGVGTSLAVSSVNLSGGAAEVPEPSTIVIALIAVAFLGCVVRRKRS